MTNSTIGIDIAKDGLDVHRLPDGATQHFANDSSGHQDLIRWITAHPVDRIVFEATGPYTRDLERALAKAGLPAVKVNPRQARHFAQAVGTWAKTDTVDAAMLARMGKALDLAPHPPHGENITLLKELMLARQALIKDRTAARNRQKIITLPVVRAIITRRIDHIEADIAVIDTEIAKHIAADPALAKRAAILTSIPGVGAITAAVLIVEMPELGTIDHKHAASLAGLAPMTQQSGTRTAKAHIRGGRAAFRHALYMPALVAARFNPTLKALYDKLLAAGKPAKVAITAVMRKLVIFANALLRDGRQWHQKLA